MIDAAINAIDALNDDFNGLNGDLNNYDALTATCSSAYPASTKSLGSCIEFCLAQYNDPRCSGVCDGEYAITAGLFAWPNTGGCYGDYINIFVQSGTGQLGIAPLGGVRTLGGNGPQVDAQTWGGPGILCTPSGLGNTFNSNPAYNLGRTLTHEMGHYFGLEHIFEPGCTTQGAPESNSDEDDGFDDTPFQTQENYGTPAVVSCTISDPGNTANNTCNSLDMWCSYMDYSNDTHLFMFTNEQSDYMYFNAGLSPIASSAIACTGGPAAPTADISLPSELPFFCSYDNAPYTMSLLDNSTRCPTSWSWTFSGAGVSPTSSTLQDPVVTVTQSGDLTVTLVSTNSSGTSTQVSKTVYVSIAVPGSCPDCGNVFVDSGGPNANYSASENNVKTYCAGANEVLNLSLTEVDLAGGLFSDVVYIYEGDMLPANLNSYVALIGEDNGSAGGVWVPNGMSVSYTGTSFQSTTNCLTFLFTSDGINEGTGYLGNISCCEATSDPECAAKNIAGNSFVDQISTYCNSMDIFDLSMLKGTIEDDSRSPCGSPGTIQYTNNAYYEVTCDGDGGNLEVTISTNLDNGGVVKGYIMGPLSGNCPDYTSGNLTIQTCEEGSTGTLTMSENNVAPNSRYLIFINSQNPGTFDIWSTMNSTALPVELVSFEAKAQGKNVHLNWITASEVNNDYFTIERSLDGVNYEHYADIASDKEQLDGAKYEFVDDRAYAGINYYSLYQTDVDGTRSFLGTRSANVAAAVSDFTMYPNPISGNKVNIDGLAPDVDFTLNMVNTSGQEYVMRLKSDNRGRGNVDITGLILGVYFVEAISQGQYYTTKLIVLR